GAPDHRRRLPAEQEPDPQERAEDPERDRAEEGAERHANVLSVKGRRPFVPCLADWRKGAAIVLSATAAFAEPGLSPRTFARGYAPGEIVRIEVVAESGTKDVHGTFGTAPVAFVAKDPTTWVGWAVIPLDAAPGPLPYLVEAGGSSVSR